MNVKKVVIYPFSEESISFLKYLHEFNPNYQVTSIVSPMGYCLSGKDAGYADHRNLLGMTVENDLEQALAKADALLVVPEKGEESNSAPLKAIWLAIKNNKEILCTLNLDADTRDQLEKACNTQGIAFHYYAREKNVFPMVFEHGISSPAAVVIFVTNIIQDNCSFELLLYLTLAFRKANFRVSVIGDCISGELLEIHTIPSFLRETGIKEEEKVKLFNIFLQNIEKEEQPEILLIQIPGGLMKYNRILTNGFGIYPYLISQAVQADYCVCVSIYDFYDKKMMEELNQHFEQCFGFMVDCYAMTGMCIDPTTSLNTESFEILAIDTDSVDKRLEEIKMEGRFNEKIPIFNARTDIGKEECFKLLYSRMEEQIPAATLFD